MQCVTYYGLCSNQYLREIWKFMEAQLDIPFIIYHIGPLSYMVIFLTT